MHKLTKYSFSLFGIGFAIAILFAFKTPVQATNNFDDVLRVKINSVPLINQNTDSDCVATNGWNVGCTVTTMAMLFQYYGISTTPNDVHASLGSCDMS